MEVNSETLAELVEKALNVRELEGNPQKAFVILQDAYRLAETKQDKAGIRAEMALCLRHSGNLDLATIYFCNALSEYFLIGDFISVARMYRQLSAILLLQGDTDGALKLALAARQSICDKKLTLNDQCHMTHGIISALLKKRKSSSLFEKLKLTREILKWVAIEGSEVKTMMQNEKTFAKYVWQTGYLSDLARSVPPFTLPVGLIALVIIKNHGLGMRKKQLSRI